MGQSFVHPRIGKDQYTCPFCRSYQTFEEFDLYYLDQSGIDAAGAYALLKQRVANEPPGFSASRCTYCTGVLLWNGPKLYYPMRHVPHAVLDTLPNELLADVMQVCRIIDVAPAAAAALLRRTLRRMCVVLSQEQDDTQSYVAILTARFVPKGHRAALAKACMRDGRDILPGLIDERDTIEVAYTLLEIVAEIAQAHFPPKGGAAS